MYGIIYKSTNKINGKIYIGQTSRTLKERAYEHNRLAKIDGDYNPLISRAIRKYGQDNFEWSVIDEADNLEELNQKEKDWIIHYRSFVGFVDSNGYNLTLGGDGRLGMKLSEESKRRMSERQIGELNHMFGRIGDANHMFGRTGELAPMYGKSGELSPTSIPVFQLDLEGNFMRRFSNAQEASVHLEIKNGSGITKCCKGKAKHCKGFIWMYETEYNEENVKAKVDALKIKKKGRRVVQLTLGGQFLANYNTIKEAEISIVGKPMGAVVNCCNGKANHYKGFKWMYEEDYLKL